MDSNDISGLRYDKKGNLTPLSNSTRELATPQGTIPGAGLPTPFADQVLFSPNGKVLTVPERLSNGFMGQLDTFRVRRSGRTGQAHANASNAFIPFGLEWDNHGHLIVANGGPPPNFSPGSGSSYSLSGTTLTPIDNKLAGDDATCWLAITNNGKYVFMINQPPGRNGSVSRFSISHDGHLTLLGTTPTSGASADTALSRATRSTCSCRTSSCPARPATPPSTDTGSTPTAASPTSASSTQASPAAPPDSPPDKHNPITAGRRYCRPAPVVRAVPGSSSLPAR